MGRVVVAGASRGIGRAVARIFARQGEEVWAGCRRPEAVDDLEPVGISVHPLDVTDERSIETFAEHLSSLGGVNTLVNAAGIDARSLGAAQDARDVWDLSPDAFLAEMRVNAVGPMLLTRALYRRQALLAGSKVINLSSRTGSLERGGAICWDIGYNASKAALNMITVRTAHLLSHDDVTVVAVHPGWVRTDMGGPNAADDVEDGAERLVDLIKQLGSEHNGSFLQPDGSPHPW